MLQSHWELPDRADSEQPLKAWFQEAQSAEWKNPHDIKGSYANASFVGDRVIFNIGGNKYRLVVWINYDYATVYTRFVGTHQEYDKINVETI